jgi:predicted acetyltransferase
MGQYFGGRSVPMLGVAGVATAPDRRGSGAAAALMRATVEELARDGVPLTSLYPATRPLYRGVGYEPAGSRFEYKVPLAALGARDRGLDVYPIGEADEPEINAVYRAFAALHNGMLDRGPYVWNRVRTVRNEVVRGFAVGAPGRVEGYTYLYQKPSLSGDKRYDLRLTDVVALTPAAATRLLAFFSDHRSLGSNVFWHGGPGDPLAQALPEVGFTATLTLSHWMLRLTDVASALTARGYFEGVRLEAELLVLDPLVPKNAGPLVLSIAGGVADVRRGGSGAVRIDVRGLAALYAGHASPTTLASLGLVEGRPADLARLALAFAGPAPWMADIF